MDAGFASAARELRDGGIGHDEFGRRTVEWTRRQAVSMLKRLGAAPAWLGREDVEQELRIELWRYSGRYDPSRERCASVEVYLSFAARKRVQKLVQKAQGLEQHRRSGLHRFERAAGGASEIDLLLERGAEHVAEGDRAALRSERYDVLRGLCDTWPERHVVNALERGGGELGPSARALWDDREARLACRLVSEEHAVAMIKRTVGRMVDTYEAKEAET